MMRRIKWSKYDFMVIMLLIYIIALAHISNAATYENIFEYELKSGKAIITKYIGINNQVAIPEVMAGATRIAIKEGAFLTDKLTKIVMLNNVRSIENGAFDKNTKVIIYGKEDSFAQKYAKENSITFRIYGDINGDDSVTATDTLKVKRHIVEADGQLLNEDEQNRADLNCDGKATATDILQLMKIVQARVLEQSGVMLEPEVRIIG